MKTTSLPSSIEVFQNNVPDWRKTEINYPLHTHLLTQDRNQAYTSLVEGVEGMKSDPTLPVDDALYSRSDIDREVDKTLTDIIENVVKPLYGKE